MNTTPITIAEAYYTAMGEKNMETLEKYLHPQVQFSSPFIHTTGKEGVFKAVKGFATVFKSLTIRAKFGSDSQAMIVYDIDCPAYNGVSSSAALMTVKDGQITNIELFFDPRPFAQQS